MKNWLIRTSSNQIFGPVSKEKVIDLIKNKTISYEDEICSGNGYWFFLREHDLVQAYVFDDEKQGFNPISEAKDTLDGSLEIGGNPNIERDHTTHLNLNEINFESEETLQQTDDESDDITQIKLPSDDDLDYPDPEATKDKIDLSEFGDLKSEGRRVSDQKLSDDTNSHQEFEDNNDSSIRYPDQDDLEYPDLELDKN